MWLNELDSGRIKEAAEEFIRTLVWAANLDLKIGELYENKRFSTNLLKYAEGEAFESLFTGADIQEKALHVMGMWKATGAECPEVLIDREKGKLGLRALERPIQVRVSLCRGPGKFGVMHEASVVGMSANTATLDYLRSRGKNYWLRAYGERNENMADCARPDLKQVAG